MLKCISDEATSTSTYRLHYADMYDDILFYVI